MDLRIMAIGGALMCAIAAAQTTSANEISGHATYYGSSYHGQRMGCWGTPYSTYDATIVAVGPARYSEWPCGMKLLVTGPAGSRVVTRQDSCPGCSANVIDLSEAANAAICGLPNHTCRVTIEPLGVD